MSKLRKEFLSYISEERVKREVGAVWQSKKTKKWSAKRADRTQPGFESREAAEAWLKGKGKAPSKKEPTGEKPEELPPEVTRIKGPERYRQGEPPKKGKKEKIDAVETSTESVVSSFGDTTLDVPGLLSAIQGKPSEEKGEKGAGTPASTAGEAAATLGIERLRQLRAQNPDMSTEDFLRMADQELTKLMSELRGVPDSILDADWAIVARNQAIAVFHTIETKFGTKISEMGWDNATGRAALGLPAKKPRADRSDLYVRTADGKIIGVSLKKDGNVYLANDGLKRALEKISSIEGTTEETKQKLVTISTTHKTAVAKGYQDLSSTAKTQRRKVRNALLSLTRDDIEDVDSAKYDQFFDKETGRLKDEVIDVMTSGNPGAQTSDAGKLFIKSMATISETVPSIGTPLDSMRAADSKACQSLLSLVESDEGVRRTVSEFMIDGLDLAQIVSRQPPFGEEAGVDGFFIAYGKADVKEDGSRHPMVVTRETILRTFGFPDDIGDDSFKEQIRERLIIDQEESGKLGFIRLKTANQEPPPPYYYPSIAQVSVRAKGLGTAAQLLMEQGSGLTYSLVNGDPNPASWTPQQRLVHARDTILFLHRQLKNPLLTDEQRVNINTEMEVFRQKEKEEIGELKKKGK